MNTITTDQLKTRIEAGEQLHLVDVREPHERTEYNIGGIHVPLGKIQAYQLEDLEDLKNEELIIYCRSGNRSGQAALILDQAGFTNTVNVVGGMLNWREKFDK